MEVVETDDRNGLVPRAAVLPAGNAPLVAAPGAADHLEEYAALAVLGLRDAHHERDRRREIDRSRNDRSLADVLATGEEHRSHVDVRSEVLDVGHVAVLTEELRWRDQ